jgi:tRNA G10  N-methylase Trm11
MENNISVRSKKYFFIFGSNPTLSLAEVLSVFEEARIGRFQAGNVFIFESRKEIDAKEIIKKIGGTIKIGIIESEALAANKKIIESLKRMVKPENISNKFNFGISNYGVKKINTKVIGMETKKYLREHNISCRWVISREPILSSVVVEQNKLVVDGMEIVLFKNGTNILIGKTLAVQPFKELSFRDYGRPARDDYSGMLPPKLAQIMINLAVPLIKREKGFYKILDPFCGSGTILTEAALMGHKDLYGSDISEKAVSDTKKNLEWTIEKFKIKNFSALPNEAGLAKLKINVLDSKELSRHYNPNFFDAIVTEPYLGPQRGRIEIKKIKSELEKLYSASLAEFYKILSPAGRVVMIFPVFNLTQEFIRPNLNRFKIINPIPEKLHAGKNIKLTDRETIIYGREGQRVWREIIILEK